MASYTLQRRISVEDVTQTLVKDYHIMNEKILGLCQIVWKVCFHASSSIEVFNNQTIGIATYIYEKIGKS